MRFCNECTDKLKWNRYETQINEKKEYEAKLNLLKRQTLKQFGHMLPYYEI